jgi:hypothetical protein
VNDVNVAVIELAQFCDIRRGWILLRNTTLGLLCRDELRKSKLKHRGNSRQRVQHD